MNDRDELIKILQDTYFPSYCGVKNSGIAADAILKWYAKKEGQNMKNCFECQHCTRGCFCDEFKLTISEDGNEAETCEKFKEIK